MITNINSDPSQHDRSRLQHQNIKQLSRLNQLQSNTYSRLNHLLTYIAALSVVIMLSGCEFTDKVDEISKWISNVFCGCLIFLVCVLILRYVAPIIVKLILKAHRDKKTREQEDARFERKMQIEEQRLNMQMRQLEYQTQQRIMSMKSNQQQSNSQPTKPQQTITNQTNPQIDLRATGFSSGKVSGGD